MTKLCEGRVAIVTGAGRGIGRAHALELARQGAKVVVNDLGASNAGEGKDEGPANEVVALIEEMGGEAVVNGADVADWEASKQLVQQAIDTFGRLDIVVNNAGFVRDQMFVNADEQSWDAVIRVHLKGHFCVARHAAAYWREQSKKGEKVEGRIINTSSGAGVLGSVGQAAYSAAKAGIATLTLVQAAELRRYGVTANAICPIARTRMTEAVFGEQMKKPEDGFDVNAPENVSPFVAWLASPESASVTGRVFEVFGGTITVFDGYRRDQTVDIGRRWEPSEITAAMSDLMSKALEPVKVYGT
ncbi:MAG: SDR family oxidoreductase [Myxococcales bacterium]|jgi:NAD(P)-dependent dehydrogenase (short-subunit alcohol dehydrogenase family)|nr:SDR family oxidoreductase [Myxococcales bacterium]